MPIQHAVLALLAERESYGYQLKASFEHAIGPQWGELNIGHMYQVLDRLLRDGLVTFRVVQQTDRPDKHLYRLTKEGRRELTEWLSTPFVRSSGHRDELFLRLFAAARLGADRLREVAKDQRRAYLSELKALAELRAQHRDDPLVGLLISAASLHTKANLEVVESAERRAEKISEAARIDPTVDNREGVRRGRRATVGEPKGRRRAG